MKKWIIANSPDASPFLKETKRFGYKDSIYLIDQYGGKLPVLFEDGNIVSLRNKEVYPCALFDSNLMNLIERRIKGIRHPGLESLLFFLTRNSWDFNPEFYLIEHYCKSPKAFSENAKKRIDYWLELYAMNQMLFLKDFEIQRDLDAEGFYCLKYGVKRMSDIAEYKIEKLFEATEFIVEMKKVASVSEILISKMILIHHYEAKEKSSIEKLQIYESFQKEVLGIGMAREFLLAMLYFNNQAGRLLGVQANTPMKIVRETISSTTWDLLLVRLPEFNLSNTSEPFTLPYVVTRERQLAHFANMVKYYELSLDDWRGYPTQEMNLDSLSEKFQQELHEQFVTLPSDTEKNLDRGFLQEMSEQLSFSLEKEFN